MMMMVVVMAAVMVTECSCYGDDSGDDKLRV